MSDVISKSRKMPRPRIEEGRILDAVVECRYGSRTFLNRNTGDLYDVYDDYVAFCYVRESACRHTPDDELQTLWQEHRAYAARLAASPDWIAIPKYPGACPWGQPPSKGQMNFVLDFLAKNGIEADLCEPEIRF